MLADTKLEFGARVPSSGAGNSAGAAEIVLADEVGTPDWSRFWPLTGWQPGETIPGSSQLTV